MVFHVDVSVELFRDEEVEARHDREKSEENFRGLLLAEFKKNYPIAGFSATFGHFTGFFLSAGSPGERTDAVRKISRIVEGLRVDRFVEWAVPLGA